MQQVANFIANSDYPFDMITYCAKYTLTDDGSNYQEDKFKHNLPYTPLLFGTWGDKEDYSGYTGTLAPAGMIFSLKVAADSEYVYVYKTAYNPTAGDKFYLKIYGFAPTTWTGDCKPTAQSGTSLLFDTDKEYAPLIASGYMRSYNISAPATNTNYSFTIGKDGMVNIPTDTQQMALNLFYGDSLRDAPKCMLWFESAETGKVEQSGWARFMSTGYPNTQTSPYVMYQSTNGGLLAINAGMRTSSQPANTFHIRVYA